jgi:hypothetical protein
VVQVGYGTWQQWRRVHKVGIFAPTTRQTEPCPSSYILYSRRSQSRPWLPSVASAAGPAAPPPRLNMCTDSSSLRTLCRARGTGCGMAAREGYRGIFNTSDKMGSAWRALKLRSIVLSATSAADCTRSSSSSAACTCPWVWCTRAHPYILAPPLRMECNETLGKPLRPLTSIPFHPHPKHLGEKRSGLRRPGRL